MRPGRRMLIAWMSQSCRHGWLCPALGDIDGDFEKLMTDGLCYQIDTPMLLSKDIFVSMSLKF
jgi:hypothetical protein